MRAHARLFLVSAAVLLAPAGCDDAPTEAPVANAYTGDSAPVVYRAWWVTTLFPDPVVVQATSAIERTIPATDFAYVLLAPGWSPDAAAPPARLVALKSREKLAAKRGELLRIEV